MDQTEKVLILDLNSWKVVKEVQIHKATVYEKHKLITELLLPGFDIETFPYSVQYDQTTNTLSLANVKTGINLGTFIQGSAQNFKDFAASFFLKSGQGFEFHFCTSRHTKTSIKHKWNRW